MKRKSSGRQGKAEPTLMKILHLIDSGGLYGAEKVLLNLAIEQKRQGMEPVMLSAGLPNIEDKAIEIEARKVGIEVVAWRMKAGLNIREGLRIIEWACSNGVKVLHSHGYKFNII
ncbi:MAG: hypothetical protein LPK45_00665, partial [Bacteroidota bacterium]|nr:hypothetical protein [Bacteroidota bacterium]MDX5468323.1 hypothetical protein [Bacteroidota bacterium]